VLSSGQEIFSPKVIAEPRWLTLFKRLLLLIVAFHLLVGVVSSYRAYYQIHSLDIFSNQILEPGSMVQTKVVTYGRSFADVKLELIQGSLAVTLHDQRVAANEFGFYDPRMQQAEFSVSITPQTLERFAPGPALLRATAVGRHQWMRLPPPVVREMTVEIRSRASRPQ
jgi:hypothetical protein